MINKLKHKNWFKIIKRSGLFDSNYYLSTYPDIRQEKFNPIMHYILYGAEERRNPSDNFDTSFYLNTNKDVEISGINPLVHYVLYGENEGRKIKPEIKQDNIDDFKDFFDDAEDYFVPFLKHEPLNSKLKTVSFYLPQFHPFPENDEWWGKGFTDWFNVTKAKPNFEGHYQPHLPIHNGFYDLRIPEVMIEQARLAKNYGIYGFNFYYYWFDGKILMHKPFEILLKHKDIDINFCITWANENWTRRWDGYENDILISQNHSEEDSLMFLDSLIKFFKDDRYIKIANKPVLIIYRADIIPNMKETIRIWRRRVKELGFEGIYLVCTQSFGTKSPVPYGFDAAMEFPPHSAISSEITDNVEFFSKNFVGKVFDYNQVVDNALKSEEPEYKLYRTAMLSWDNTARRQLGSHIFDNFSLTKYNKWLSNLLFKVNSNEKYKEDEKLVFINAWNEWAEGTHLEPDRKYGYGYLEATYNAIKRINQKKIIIVSHDAHPSGAEFLALNIAKYLKEYFDYNIIILLGGDGELLSDFEKVGETYLLHEFNKAELAELLSQLKLFGYKKAIANTSVIGEIVEELTSNNIEVASLIHEMKSIIKKNELEKSIEKISKFAKYVIFPSSYVKDDFEEFVSLTNVETFIIPQGLFRKNRFKYNKSAAKTKLLVELGIEENSKIILNIAHGDYRKGIDLFVEAGIQTILNNNNIHFVWVGSYTSKLMCDIEKKIKESKTNNNFHFLQFKYDIDHYYAGCDLFFLSSREDPFPSVVLDAMNVGIPVVAFAGNGGFVDIISEDCGVLVPDENCKMLSDEIISLLYNREKYLRLSKNSKYKIETDLSFMKYIFYLLRLIKEDVKRISVIIPSYNYEKYIKARLESILSQTYPIFEIIYLDDNSNDNSLVIAEEILRNGDIPYRIIKNEHNSGNVFKQWVKGMSNVSGDYIWIAESDDLSDNTFLEKTIKGFNEKDVALSYCQSKMIDERDNVISENYLDYTNDISKTKWENDYIIDGIEELKTAMVVKNTIPNISSVLFKKFDIAPILDKLYRFKIAGDWFFYTCLLRKGNVSYIAESLNMHRRHLESVTASNNNNAVHFKEIIEMQDYICDICNIDKTTLDLVYRYRKVVAKILEIE